MWDYRPSTKDRVYRRFASDVVSSRILASRATLSEYIIALKRGIEPDEDWREVLASLPGLTVKNPGARRLRVDATDDAIADVRAKLSQVCHIEPVIKRELF